MLAQGALGVGALAAALLSPSGPLLVSSTSSHTPGPGAATTAPSGGRATAPPATAPPATAPPATGQVPPARSYVLVDVTTGNVLAGYRENLRVPPASLTKVLTALIAVTYLPPDATVPGTLASSQVYPNQVGIEKGVPWPLDEVLQSMLVYSANDAAYAIAQRVSGSLDGFGAVMDRSAAQIGMTGDPQFHDPAGLDGTEGVDGGNLVSARDLAIAGRDLLRVPELARIVTEQQYDFVDPTGAAHDLPSMNLQFLQGYPGAVGIKTGFTNRAGACIMAAATRGGRTMLAVVMNGYNDTQTAIDLLDEGFATPVAAEPTTDRLPAPALPVPPWKVRAHALRRNGAPGRRVPNEPGASAASALGRARAAGGGRGPSAGASLLPQGSLATVAESWPGQLLLALTGLGAVVAMREIFVTNRARQQIRKRSR